MDIFGTHKTWKFSVSATPEQCFQAFFEAMTHRGFKFIGTKWTLERGHAASPTGDSPWPATIATYQGRGGVLGGMSNFIPIESVQNEIKEAKGSQLTFAINPERAAGKTECSLWLSKFSSKFGFTADGRFILFALHDVEKHLRKLDPMLVIDKV